MNIGGNTSTWYQNTSREVLSTAAANVGFVAKVGDWAICRLDVGERWKDEADGVVGVGKPWVCDCEYDFCGNKEKWQPRTEWANWGCC
jgi:hypothetical protein